MRFRAMLAMYDCAAHIAVVMLLLPLAVIEVLLGRSSWRRVRERLGYAGRAAGGPRRIVVHAVSVGELRAAVPFIDALPGGLSVVLSTGNRDGLRVAENLARTRPRIERVVLLPWDASFATKRWVARLGVERAAVVETELWPNLFRAFAAAGVPLAIVNGRIYPRDTARYALVRSFFARVLDDVSWIGVQSREEYERFVAVGAAPERVEVVGSLKLDLARTASTRDRDDATPPRVIAAATHAGEERIVATALAACGGNAKLVIAPRHVARARRIARDLARVLPGSSIATGDGMGDVEIVDTIGDLPDRFRRGDVAVIGGTFVRRGGQNPLEAAAAGCAIVAGPHVEHIEPLIEVLARHGAIVRCDASSLAGTLATLLGDDARRRQLGDAARDAVANAPRCAERYVAAVMSMRGSGRAAPEGSAQSSAG